MLIIFKLSAFSIFVISLTSLFVSCGENTSYFAKKVATAPIDAAPEVSPAGTEGEGDEPKKPDPVPTETPGNPGNPGTPGNPPQVPPTSNCPTKISSIELGKNPELLKKIACPSSKQNERYALCHQTHGREIDDDNEDNHDKIVLLRLPQQGLFGHLGLGQELADDHDLDHTSDDFLLDCSNLSLEELKAKDAEIKLCHCDD